MEGIVQLCLGGLCLLSPILLLAIVGGIYGLSIDAIKLPGIGRAHVEEGKDWITVPDFSKKILEGFAAILSLIGALFGLIGFLLPWVRVNLSAAGSFLNLGGLNGTLSGIALAFQSMVAGFGLFSVDVEGATGLGIILILLSLVVWLIPLAILITAGIGAGLVSIPLGLVKAQIPKLSRSLLIMSIISLCLVCGFFAGIQATVGGVKVGGSEGLFGTSISMGVEVTNGFWITFGGLLLTFVGAIVANTLAGALSNWSQKLASLDRSKSEKETS